MKFGSFARAAILLIAPVASAVAAQGGSQPSAGNLNIPGNVQFVGQTQEGVRKATAIVNGDVITGSDVDHRVNLLIATKCLGRMGPGPNDAGASRLHIIAACEASLKRLKTDYIDLYQIHNQDSLVPVEETLRALDDLVTAGKVRYIGSSNHWPISEIRSPAVAAESLSS